ncbi:hypothetical protein BC567DRAFT_227690 [Phyllosticta citribraziliensis]
MATFNDLNDDVLLIVIDFLAEESLRRDSKGRRRNHLVALSSANRRLRYLATWVAKRSVFHSVSLEGGSLPAQLNECVFEGCSLDIPKALERTRSLRIPYPYVTPFDRDLTVGEYELNRLLRTPQRLEKLDAGHSRISKTARRDRFSGMFFHNGDFRQPVFLRDNPTFTLRYVKELSIYQDLYYLGRLCPNVESIKVRRALDSGTDAEEMLSNAIGKFRKSPHLISFELDSKVEPELVKTIYTFLPNLERLALTGSGLNMIYVENRERIISALAHFPRLHTFSFRHDFKSSSRPWGDSPEEPPDYRMDCLIGGPSLENEVPYPTRLYFARHSVRFFEGCLALTSLFLNPLNEFYLLEKEPDLAIKWVQKEKSEEEPQDDSEAWLSDWSTTDEEDDRGSLQSVDLSSHSSSDSSSE